MLSKKSRKNLLENLKIQKKLHQYIKKIKEDELCSKQIDKTLIDLKESIDKFVEFEHNTSLVSTDDADFKPTLKEIVLNIEVPDETFEIIKDNFDIDPYPQDIKRKIENDEKPLTLGYLPDIEVVKKQLNRQLRTKISRVLNIQELEEISKCNAGQFFIFNENKIKMTLLLKSRIQILKNLLDESS